MVTLPPQVIAEHARALFAESDLPPEFAFVQHFTPLHQRLFIRDLWLAVSRWSVTPSQAELDDLVALIEEWEATADLDAAPDVAAEIRAPKSYRQVDIT